MTKLTHRTIVSGLLLTLCAAASPGRAAEGNPPTNPKPAAPGAQGAIVVGEGGWTRFAVNGQQVKSVWSTMATLGELNLTADFTLTAEQKEKIQGIREEVKRRQEQWRTDHAEDFKHIQELTSGLQLGGGGRFDQEKWKEIQAAQVAVQQTAPKEGEAVDQIRGLLTTDQLRRLDEFETRRRAENERYIKEAQGRTKELTERVKAEVKEKAKETPAK